MSSPIIVEEQLMRQIKLDDPILHLPSLYVRSVYIDDYDTITVAAGINDNACFIIRIRGIEQILNLAIENDQNSSTDKCEASKAYESMERKLGEITSDTMRKHFYVI